MVSSPPLISLMVTVDVKHHVYLLTVSRTSERREVELDLQICPEEIMSREPESATKLPFFLPSGQKNDTTF